MSRPKKSRLKYVPLAWVWRTLLEMREPHVDPTLIMYSHRSFSATLGRLYRDATPPQNETVSKRLDQLEELGFINRPPPAERRQRARDFFAYPIRLLKDELAALDGIFDIDRKVRSPIAQESPPPGPPMPGPVAPGWVPGTAPIRPSTPPERTPPPRPVLDADDGSADGFAESAPDSVAALPDNEGDEDECGEPTDLDGDGEYCGPDEG